MPRISDLTRVNEVSDGDVFPIEQASSGRTRSVAFKTIRDDISADVAAAVSVAVAAAAAAEKAAASSDAQVLRGDLSDGATALKGADLVAYAAGETVRDAIAAGKQFQADLEDTTDPAKGAAIVGYQGGTVADKLAQIVEDALTEAEVNTAVGVAVSSHNSDPAAHPALSAFITSEANRAETARDAAFVNADLYETTAAGIAATAVGEQFQVLAASGDEYIRYRHDVGGVATVLPNGFPTPKFVRDSRLNLNDSSFLEDIKSNLFTRDYYSSILPVPGASGTVVEFTNVDGEPAVKLISRDSDGAGIVDYNFTNISSLASGKCTFGIKILSSENKGSISRFQISFISAAGSFLRTDTYNENFYGVTDGVEYFYTATVPDGTDRVRIRILAYGGAGDPRTTIFSRMMFIDGAVSAFIKPAKIEAAASRTVWMSAAGNDANPGTEASPKLTLQNCIDSLNGEGVVKVVTGEYTYAQFSINEATVKNITIDGVIKDLNSPRPLIRLGYKLSNITLESGKVYKATGASSISAVNAIWHDSVPDPTTLVPTSERHSLLRGRAHRLPCTRIKRVNEATVVAGVAAIQSATEPRCYYDNGTNTIYFSIAGGADPTGEPIYMGSGLADGTFGSLFTTGAARIGQYGELYLRNLEFRYGNVNLRPHVYWEAYNVSVLGGRINNFDYAGAGRLSLCEAMGADGGGGSGGDGFNGQEGAFSTMEYCYTHDNNDDGESTHVNCVVNGIGCISEYNGSAGFIPASGGHGTYHNCVSRKNAQNGGSNSGFDSTGSSLDVGIDTTVDCYNCLSVDEAIGFQDRTGTRLIAHQCTSVGNTSTGFACYKAIDCGYEGTGVPKGASTVAVSTTKVV